MIIINRTKKSHNQQFQEFVGKPTNRALLLENGFWKRKTDTLTKIDGIEFIENPTCV